MDCSLAPDRSQDLARQVQQRTKWRVRNLVIEINCHQAVLRGETTTTFTRLLAQQIVSDCLPHLTVENAIGVTCSTEVWPGLPLH